MGELIHEPLNDRLRFVMIDLPFLRSMYVQNGYKAGLELERAFGEYLAERIENRHVCTTSRMQTYSTSNLTQTATPLPKSCLKNSKRG